LGTTWIYNLIVALLFPPPSLGRKKEDCMKVGGTPYLSCEVCILILSFVKSYFDETFAFIG